MPGFAFLAGEGLLGGAFFGFLQAVAVALNGDDFEPTIWQSYQWDQGFWALPFAASPYVLTYDPAAFDNAHLAYPDDTWTLDDLTKAVTTLSYADANGKASRPGIDIYGGQTQFALRGLITGSTIDESVVPSTPKFDNAPRINPHGNHRN